MLAEVLSERALLSEHCSAVYGHHVHADLTRLRASDARSTAANPP